MTIAGESPPVLLETVAERVVARKRAARGRQITALAALKARVKVEGEAIRRRASDQITGDRRVALFDAYVKVGALKGVAAATGVNIKSVRKLCELDHWKKRREDIIQKALAITEDSVALERAQSLSFLRMSKRVLARDIAQGKVQGTYKDLVEIIRQEELMTGGVTERVTIEAVSKELGEIRQTLDVSAAESPVAGAPDLPKLPEPSDRLNRAAIDEVREAIREEAVLVAGAPGAATSPASSSGVS